MTENGYRNNLKMQIRQMVLQPHLHAQDLHKYVNLYVCIFTIVYQGFKIETLTP